MGIYKATDTNKTNIFNDLVGIYYYLLDNERLKANDYLNTSILGFVPTIQSISYNPFFDMNDNEITINEIEFDKEHFGSPSNDGNPKVYRVKTLPSWSKTLKEIDLKETTWQYLDEDYETRLLFYPFKYFLLVDHLNPPMIIKPELINDNGKFSISVKVGISSTSKYNLYLGGYKNDFRGNIEGLVNNNPLLFPVGSSAYSQFLATSGSVFSQGNALGLLENDVSLKQNTQNLNLQNIQNIVGSLGGVIGNLSSGNIGGAIQGGINGGFNYANNSMQQGFANQNHQLKEFSIESMALAKKNDLLNTPRSMKSMGNDGLFNMDLGGRVVELIEYGLTDNYTTKLSRFFKRYGYKVNKIGYTNLYSRKYYNFVKFLNCNIMGGKIPQNDLKEIESIFESGITLWHVEDGAKVRDYSQKNLER